MPGAARTHTVQLRSIARNFSTSVERLVVCVPYKARNTVCNKILASRRCQQLQPGLAACRAGTGDARSEAAHTRAVFVAARHAAAHRRARRSGASTQLCPRMCQTSPELAALSVWCPRDMFGLWASVFLPLFSALRAPKTIWNAFRAREDFTCRKFVET